MYTYVCMHIYSTSHDETRARGGLSPDKRRTAGLISEDSEESEGDILQEMRRIGDNSEDDGSDDNDDDDDEDSDKGKGKKDELYHDKRFISDERFTTTR
jgi:hypothetical protein